MTPSEIDLALETLLTVRAELFPTLDEATLRRCYMLQRKYQFDQVRAASSQAMERVIDELVDQTTTADSIRSS